MKAATFAGLLKRARYLNKKRGWEGECPACKRFALSFKDCKNGLGLGCFFGCHARDIAAARGLTMADFHEPPCEVRVGGVTYRPTFASAQEEGAL